MTHDDICPDAETLAAWTDAGVPPDERRAIELHVSTCSRCQAVLAAAVRAETAAMKPVHMPARVSWRWMATAAVAAAAIVVFAVMRTSNPPAPAPAPATLSAKAEPSAGAREPAQEPAAPAERAKKAPSEPLRRPAAPPPARLDANNSIAVPPPAESRQTLADATTRDERGLQKTNESIAANAPAARAMAEAVALPEIISSDPSRRWRIRGTAVERSDDAGATWTPQSTGTSVPLTAGASPSPDVCWIVGRRGTVLRSLDGRTWQLIVFPDSADLVSISTTGPATATVTTADARRFTTDDGGATWRAGGLQEF